MIMLSRSSAHRATANDALRPPPARAYPSRSYPKQMRLGRSGEATESQALVGRQMQSVIYSTAVMTGLLYLLLFGLR